MCFHAARFKARLGDNQELIDLEHQDRSLYNQELIRIGIFHLENSETVDKKPSHYHLEAAVSYWHCIATSFEETNWKQILNLYDLHLQSLYSPIVALNRIIPYYKLNGAEQAMKELNAFKKRPHFTESALFYAIEAELLIGLGKEIEAVCVLKKAIAWSTNVMEKRHFIKKAAFLERNTVSKSKF